MSDESPDLSQLPGFRYLESIITTTEEAKRFIRLTQRALAISDDDTKYSVIFYRALDWSEDGIKDQDCPEFIDIVS
jgi:hypothetical protein